MKVLIVFLVGVIAAGNVVSSVELVDEEWKSFMASHKKVYADDTEEKFRMKIFMENKDNIAKHNQLYENGLVSFKLSINKYADLLQHEFTAFNGYNKTVTQSKKGAVSVEEGETFMSSANGSQLVSANGSQSVSANGSQSVSANGSQPVPATVDWRTTGAVTPVKNQGQCDSCWSFSATGALEGQHFQKTGVLVSLSEQNLVDCSSAYGNDGCNGGSMDNAFRYITGNGGIDTEKAYPYEAKGDTCRYNAKNSGATDKGFVDIEQGNEEEMMQTIATVGPVSAAIDASHQSFQFYSEGVYYEPLCDSENLDHGVLVVGYGTDETSGSDYWIVKNSWGTSWGDEGYIKMARNQENNCGIASASSYPLV